MPLNETPHENFLHTPLLWVTLGKTGRSHIADTLSHFVRSWHHTSRSWGGLLARVGCWSNNSGNSHPCPGAFNCRLLCACLVLQCSYSPHRPRHQRRLANCDWMPAPYTSGQPCTPRRHPTYWASLHWSHTVSSTPCHGAWKSTTLCTYPSIECKRTVPQTETPICTRNTTSHQFIWQQQHTCDAVGGSPMECGVGEQPHKTPHFHPRHRHPSPRNDPPKKSLGPA